MILELIEQMLGGRVALIVRVQCDGGVSNVEVHIHVQGDAGLGLLGSRLGDRTVYLKMSWASSLAHD